MIQIEYIIGFAMAISNTIKKQIPQNNKYQDIIPFVAVICCITLNIINALVFGGDITIAGKDAFISSCIVVGIFSGGNAIGKAIKTEHDE